MWQQTYSCKLSVKQPTSASAAQSNSTDEGPALMPAQTPPVHPVLAAGCCCQPINLLPACPCSKHGPALCRTHPTTPPLQETPVGTNSIRLHTTHFMTMQLCRVCCKLCCVVPTAVGCAITLVLVLLGERTGPSACQQACSNTTHGSRIMIVQPAATKHCRFLADSTHKTETLRSMKGRHASLACLCLRPARRFQLCRVKDILGSRPCRPAM